VEGLGVPVEDGHVGAGTKVAVQLGGQVHVGRLVS
jgi:hypothetical protein